jgi:hypothetical protein
LEPPTVILLILRELLLLVLLVVALRVMLPFMLTPRGLLAGVGRQIRGVIYGGDRMAQRALAMLELKPVEGDEVLGGLSADGRVRLRFMPLVGEVPGMFVIADLSIEPHHPRVRFAMSRRLFLERVGADLRAAGELADALDVVRDQLELMRFVPSDFAVSELIGDRDLDSLVSATGAADDVLWLMREELRAALLGLLGTPRDGVTWHGVWFDERGLHASAVLCEQGGKLTPTRLVRPVQELARVLSVIAHEQRSWVSVLAEQVERGQSPGYRERCAQLLIARAPKDPTVLKMLERCVDHYQSVELRVIGLAHHPERVEPGARERLLLESAMVHCRREARDAAIQTLVEGAPASLLARQDIPQFLRMRLMEAGLARWGDEAVVDALDAQVARWTEAELHEFAREAQQRGWSWASALVEASLRAVGLSERGAAQLIEALLALAPGARGERLLALALGDVPESTQLAGLSALGRLGDEAALRALLAQPQPLTRHGVALSAQVQQRYASALAALQQRGDLGARGALSLASDGDEGGALEIVERGALEIVEDVGP